MRILKIKRFIAVILVLLIVRLSYIAIIRGGELKKEAFAQQTDVVSRQNGREYIYDDKMRVIAGRGIRYNNDGILSHVVGYTWNGGASGLEKAFNDKLVSKNPDVVRAVKDANGNEVKQYYIKGSRDYGGIKLTIDYNIQKAVEQVMDSEKMTGAVIVVNAKTGGISAMASRPNVNQNTPGKYLDGSGGELINRAISQYNLGSVFKVVTAAAALETGFSNEFVFNCTGKTEIDGLDFLCSKEEGHGEITFTEGFAYSCNCLFYHLGEQTGYEQIKKYAQLFGFGEEVLKINGFNEYKGNIPRGAMTKRELANISIGQGDIMATPLQVADMMCTVANNGVRKQITLIGGIVDKNGNSTDIKPTETGRIISVDTARMLKQMLRETVMYGTGKNAEIEKAPAAGKTSTAETGWEKDGRLLTHGWFAGYFPYDAPKYVCVVLAEGGSSGAVSAAPVFRKIGEKILDL